MMVWVVAQAVPFVGKAFNMIWRVLMIRVPLLIVVAVAVWLMIDKRSAVRQAVGELVAAEELAAERAKSDALQRINAETARRVAAARLATRLFQEQLATTEANKQELSDELDDIRANPVSADAVVSPDILERLRNR